MDRDEFDVLRGALSARVRLNPFCFFFVSLRLLLPPAADARRRPGGRRYRSLPTGAEQEEEEEHAEQHQPGWIRRPARERPWATQALIGRKRMRRPEAVEKGEREGRNNLLIL